MKTQEKAVHPGKMKPKGFGRSEVTDLSWRKEKRHDDGKHRGKWAELQRKEKKAVTQTLQETLWETVWGRGWFPKPQGGN